MVNDREKEKEEKKRVGEWNEELSGFELEESTLTTPNTRYLTVTSARNVTMITIPISYIA